MKRRKGPCCGLRPCSELMWTSILFMCDHYLNCTTGAYVAESFQCCKWTVIFNVAKTDHRIALSNIASASMGCQHCRRGKQ